MKYYNYIFKITTLMIDEIFEILKKLTKHENVVPQSYS